MIRLLDFLFPPRNDEMVVRRTTESSLLALLSPRLVTYTTPATVALLPFHHEEVRSALHEAKYHGNERAFSLLALVLAEYLADLDTLGSAPAVITAMPLGKQRVRERGYNQVAAVLEHSLATHPEHPLTFVPDLLERVRETASQVSLPREKRSENMRGAFGATYPLDPRYLYIVVDDVVTTGATLQAAADALSAAGAVNILPLALAH